MQSATFYAAWIFITVFAGLWSQFNPVQSKPLHSNPLDQYVVLRADHRRKLPAEIKLLREVPGFEYFDKIVNNIKSQLNVKHFM
jgi:hypothetical protein